MEKGHTSLLSAFKFNFHSWFQINAELTSDWTAASASSFLRIVVRFETSSAKRAITASLLHEEAKLLMQNRKTDGVRTVPWSRPWVKHRLELQTLKSWTRALRSLKKDWTQLINVTGIRVQHVKQYFFSPNCIECFAEILKCLYSPLHWALLKTIFYCLNYLSNLSLAAPTFKKTSLESTEQVAAFSDSIRKINRNAL